MGKPRRMSISIKGLTYHRLKRWCDANGKTVSGVIEEWSEARLRSNSPTTPRCLYVAELPDGLQWIIAVNENAALGFINEEGVTVKRVDLDVSRLTSWHYGLLTGAEAVELLGEKSVSTT